MKVRSSWSITAKYLNTYYSVQNKLQGDGRRMHNLVPMGELTYSLKENLVFTASEYSTRQGWLLGALLFATHE